MGRWGNGVMGRWGDGKHFYRVRGTLNFLTPTPYSLLPTPYSRFPTPYSLLPTGAPSSYFILSYSEVSDIHFQGGYYLIRHL